MAVLTMEDVHSAMTRILPYVRRTPVVHAEVDGMHVLLKLESRQRTGAFKLRGAVNALAAQERFRNKQFYTASAGNHGLGAAAAARLLGGHATIFVYEGASREKIRRIARVGGEIIEAGRDYDEAEELAITYAKNKSAPFLHPFDDPFVIAGQGTVAVELLEEKPEIDMLIVPVGGGGLLAGCAVAARYMKPSIRIYGVQPEESPAMVRSLEAKTVVETPIGDTVCDALAGRFVSQRTLSMSAQYADGVVTVKEKTIREAMRLLFKVTGIRAEPSAVVGIAALLEGAAPADGIPATIISGGNISKKQFAELIAEGSE